MKKAPASIDIMQLILIAMAMLAGEWYSDTPVYWALYVFVALIEIGSFLYFRDISWIKIASVSLAVIYLIFMALIVI